jgi:hypothetical protein
VPVALLSECVQYKIPLNSVHPVHKIFQRMLDIFQIGRSPSSLEKVESAESVPRTPSELIRSRLQRLLTLVSKRDKQLRDNIEVWISYNFMYTSIRPC